MWKWCLSITLAVLLSLSGCISPYQGGDDDADVQVEPEPEPVSRSASSGYECDVGAAALPVGDQSVCDGHEITLPKGVFHLEITATWESSQAQYSVHAEDPDGTEHVASDRDEREATLDIDEPMPGRYAFWVERDSLPFADHIEVVATYYWMENATGEAPDLGSLVRVERQGDGWMARITYRNQGNAGPAADVSLDTVNGDIVLTAISGSKSEIVAEAFARAASEDRARELVLDLHVSMSIRGGKINADVDHTDARPGNRESVGADLLLTTPATISGDADTTNGDVVFEDNLPVDGFSADTTNGDVRGTLTGKGTIGGDTTNGEIDLKFTPTGAAALNLDSTNGGITLTLKEDATIGYRIGASNTNGDISESMREASLSGGDHDKVLETEGRSGRSIAVTGDASTTNGSIQFDSL